MARRWNPSDELFSARVGDLIRTRGVNYVANLTNRTPQTVRRWGRGGQARNISARQSVARAGLRTVRGESQTPSVRVVQSRVGGRFSTEGQIVSSGLSRRYREARTSAEARIEAARESAQTPRQREMADSLTVEEQIGTQADWATLNRQRAALDSMDIQILRQEFGEDFTMDMWDEYNQRWMLYDTDKELIVTQ